MIDIYAKRIDAPDYKLIMYLNKYEESKIENEKLQFLFKNLKTHFKKLFYSVTYINKIQNDEDFIKNYDQSKIVSISAVEYCYYKISTIWDIAYQIADILIFPKKNKGKGFNRYKYLEDKFECYSSKYDALKLDWYREFNGIRNKIVHGGITVNTYYVDDKFVSKRICFQAYNFELDDLITPYHLYSNKYNNDINFADNYFAFYTHLIYSYLTDFFDFVLMELNKDHGRDLENLSLDCFLYEQCERDTKTWLLSDVDDFAVITKRMLALEIQEGHLNSIDRVPDEKILAYFERFPFTMMKKIREGDFTLSEEKS